MEKITLGEENITSIGLFFEPDFFRIHCYSDVDGKQYTKTASYNRLGNYDFSSVQSKIPLFAVSSHAYWTLIPTSIFREEDAKRYLELNTGFNGQDSFGYSTLHGLEAVLIYQRDKEAEKLVSKIQVALETKHVAGILLEHGRRKAKMTGKDLLCVQVLDQSAVVILFNRGSLLLANSVEVTKSDDLIYYLFYTLKKLDISVAVEAEFGGSGEILPEVITQAAKFLTNIQNPEPNSNAHLLAEIIPECA